MARIRQIKPEFFLDDVLAQCSRDVRYLFIGLWPLADRAGRLENRPAKIKAQIYPYDSDVSVQKVVSWLNKLAESSFIIQYRANSHNYIQIRTFTKHQHCHMKEPESTIPPPPEEPYLSGASTVQEPETGASTVQEPSKPGGFLSIDNGVMDNGVLVPGSPGVGLASSFDEFWSLYPRREGKQKAWEEFQKIHPSGDLMIRWWGWLEQAKQSEQWMDKSKIPFPSTWLHQRRWEGDPPPLPVIRSKSETPMEKHLRELEEKLHAK